MTLGLVPKVFNAIYVILLFGKQLAVVDSEVFKFCHIQRIITAPTIRIDDTVRNDFALNNRREGDTRCVGNTLRVNTATAL